MKKYDEKIQFVMQVADQNIADEYIRRGWILLSVHTAGIALPGILRQCMIYTLGWPAKLPERRTTSHFKNKGFGSR